MTNFRVVNPVQPSHRIALLIETSLASGRDMLAGIARFNREFGCWSLYHQPRGLEEDPFATIRTWQGDGIIARIQSASWLERLRDLKTPVIDLLGVVQAIDIPRVIPDDARIAELAFEHFWERGFREFAFVGFEGEAWSERRQQAFTAKVERQSKVVHAYVTPRHDHQRSWDSQLASLSHWFQSLSKPIGVFIGSDQRGPESIEACQRAGLHIPGQVALLGVDNDDTLCSIGQPSLSSVCPNHECIGYEAARLMDAWLRGNSPPLETIVPPRSIVIRQSTDILSVSDTAVVKALRYIHEQSHRPISLDDVAKAACLSRSVLQRRFRKLLNMTVLDEIVRTRLKKSQTLLAETNLPLVEIAERCGFNHQEYFGHVFKQRLNDTPAAYRARVRGARKDPQNAIPS